MGAQVDLPSCTRHVVDWLGLLSRYTSLHYINAWCRIVVAVNSPMGVNARWCTKVFAKSDSKHYIRQSLCDEWRCVSHRPTNWWALLCLLCQSFDILLLRPQHGSPLDVPLYTHYSNGFIRYSRKLLWKYSLVFTIQLEMTSLATSRPPQICVNVCILRLSPCVHFVFVNSL